MNGRRFGLWTLLVAVSAAPGLARDSRSRPLLAPVALEARCPLADGTWQLGPVANIAARPAVAPQQAKAKSEEAAPAPAKRADAVGVAEAATQESCDAQPQQELCESFPPVPSEGKIDELLGEYLSYDLNPRDRFRLRLFPLALPQFSYLPGVERAIVTPDDAVAKHEEQKVAAAPEAPTSQREAAAVEEEAAVEEAYIAACFPIESTTATETASDVSAVELHGPPAPAPAIELPPSLLARFGSIDCFLDDMCWRAGLLADSLPQRVRSMLRRIGRDASGPALALHRTSHRVQQLALAAASAPEAAEPEISVALKAPIVPSASTKPPIVSIRSWASSGRSVCCPIAQSFEYGGLYDKRFEDSQSPAPAVVEATSAPADATLEATADTLDAVAGWLQGLSRSLRDQSQRIAERTSDVELR